MLDWWFAWHGIESLRYKIWDPKDHYSACVSKRHLKQRMDSVRARALAKLLPLVYPENAHIPQKEEDFVFMDFSR